MPVNNYSPYICNTTMPTKLIYLEQMGLLQTSAQVLEVQSLENGRVALLLDQTVFYPQGGGQPYDTGNITSQDAEFEVQEVRYLEGQVLHIGQFTKGTLTSEEQVTLEVDSDRRQLHRRLHSAAHVIDMVLAKLKPNWAPGKGYHFPQGPYVEYAPPQNEPLVETEREPLKTLLENKINEITKQNLPTSIKFVTWDELTTLVRHMPENLPKDKPLRVVIYPDPSPDSEQAFAVPCGGTHVDNLLDIGHIGIRKIKPEKGNIKVSYAIS